MRKITVFICTLLLSLTTAWASTIAIGDYRVVYSSDGSYRHTLTSLDGLFQFNVDFDSAIKAGQTYTYDDMGALSHCIDYAQNKALGIEVASFTWSQIEELDHIVASFTLEDMRVFDIDYTGSREIVPTDTLTVKLDNLSMMDWAESIGQIVIMAHSDEYAIDMWINTKTVAGHYTEKDLDLRAGFSYIKNVETRAQTAIIKAEFEIGYVGKDPFLRGYVIGSDHKYYVLDLGYKVPAPSREVDIMQTGGELEDKAKRHGYIQYYCVDEEVTYKVVLSLLTDKLYAGVYNRDNLYNDYSIVEEYGEEENKRMIILDANLELTLLTDTTAEITGFVIAQNKDDHSEVAQYNLTLKDIHIIGENMNFEFDAEEDDFVMTYSTDLMWIEDRYFDEMGQFYLEVDDYSTHSIVRLVFNMALDAKKEDGILPGVYPINNSGEDNTVKASDGPMNGQATASFVAYYDFFNDQLDTPLWFLVSGEVTVEIEANASPKVHIDALNSYGRKIDVLIVNTAEGVKNAEQQTATTKMLRGGQLILERAGVQYNILGTQL